MKKAKVINNDMLNLKQINTTKKVSLQEIFDGSLTPPIRESRTTKDNEHLFKPKSFKPKLETIMDYSFRFHKWMSTTHYVWTGEVYKNIRTNKVISVVKIYKEFLAEQK